MPTATLPPGPQIPAKRQKRQFSERPLVFLETCARTYGDIFTLQTNTDIAPQVFISNPQAIEQIFTAKAEILDSGAQAGQALPLMGKNSLFALSGKAHQRDRKLLMPPFHGKRMHLYGQLVRDITQQVSHQWQPGEQFSARDCMEDISLMVMLKAVFGLADGERYQQIHQLLTAEQNPGETRQNWILRQRQSLDALIYEEIRERQTVADSSRTDIMTLMMSARDELGQPMTELELRDELMTLLVAGHDTTATSLAWALYWIHSLPQVGEKLREELVEIGESLEINAILQLPYLNAICQETLRIYPVIIVTEDRVVKQPFEVMGYHFEPGIRLIPCIYLTHRREDIYPEAAKFKPERFLERKFSPYEYFPFGGSHRTCIGRAFAQFEMKLVLATLLSHWQLELAEDANVYPVYEAKVLQPAGGVKMVVKRRIK